MESQKAKTDPQEDEKEGNVLGTAFDKVFGNVNGDNSVSEGDKGSDIEHKKDAPVPNADKPLEK